MLTAAPLAELLKMTRDELKETCPWIPHRIIAVSRFLCHFEKTLHPLLAGLIDLHSVTLRFEQPKLTVRATGLILSTFHIKVENL